MVSVFYLTGMAVELSNLGESKAKAVSALLHELNDSVKAKFVEESPDTLIETNPKFFSSFSVVIATQVFLSIFPIYLFGVWTLCGLKHCLDVTVVLELSCLNSSL